MKNKEISLEEKLFSILSNDSNNYFCFIKHKLEGAETHYHIYLRHGSHDAYREIIDNLRSMGDVNIRLLRNTLYLKDLLNYMIGDRDSSLLISNFPIAPVLKSENYCFMHDYYIVLIQN